MASRIFVRGLPPNISEDEFKKHFAARHTITDTKLIPHRRIGYVGYQSESEAMEAVKHFNRSFIRLSRIGVELARPILRAPHSTSTKPLREEAQDPHRPGCVSKAATLVLSRKRKRGDIDEADPRLEEFLEAMLPKSNSRASINQGLQKQNFGIPPKEVQLTEPPQVDSDQEYGPVLNKSIAVLPETAIPQLDDEEVDNLDSRTHFTGSLDTLDDEWLRSRTNRLLDLVDPDDLNKLATPEAVRENPCNLLGDHSPAGGLVTGTGLERVNQRQPEIEESLEVVDPSVKSIQTNGRLFVRNLPYSVSEDDIRKFFESYGTIDECHLPLDASGASKGFVLVQFQDPNAAVKAYQSVDGEPFKGRLLHVLPAAAKRESKLNEFAISKLPFKKQKQIKKKAEVATNTFNWNSLYMNQDAVNSSIADRLGVPKSELLDPTSADTSVRQAIAETSAIQEAKAYFANNGVDLDAFKKRECGDTAILVKNFSYGTTATDLRKIFEEFGQVRRVLNPPSGTIAIVEFAQAPQARVAFASLAYRRIKDSVLFLEKAPKDLFKHCGTNNVVNPPPNESTTVALKPSSTDLLEREREQTINDTSTLFVRNLNFSTTSEQLAEVFKPLDGFMSARVNTKTDPKKPGRVLSMGFGFLEFRTKVQAEAALSAMDGYVLDDHKLLIKTSRKGLDDAEQRKKGYKAGMLVGKRTKIIIKNLPFEASKRDVRKLFGAYGQLRSVRVPQKFDHSTRGFAFADFVSAREAENAVEALKDTHLLGRRLVIEFAAEDAIDAEEEIEKMQRKVGKQVNRMALQKLMRRDRKKFNVDGNDIGND